MKKKCLSNNKEILIEPKIKFKLLLITACITLLFTGCQSKHTNIDNGQLTESITMENDSADVITNSSNINEVSSNIENSNRESDLQFSELSKYQFVFSSGAGAWRTTLNINEDGTFEGYFLDSDMGEIGDDYPNGTVYLSEFEGKFTMPKKVNNYTYSMEIEYIKLGKEVDTEEIIDGIKYIYSEPYGLDDAKEIYIYTLEAPIKELPEGFRSWVGYRNLSNVKEEYLPFYGLYNVDAECGFSSYLIDKIEKD